MQLQKGSLLDTVTAPANRRTTRVSSGPDWGRQNIPGASGVCLLDAGHCVAWWTQALDVLWPSLSKSGEGSPTWGAPTVTMATGADNTCKWPFWQTGRSGACHLLQRVKELRIAATLGSDFRFPLPRVQISVSLQNLTWNQFQGHVSAVSGKWQWGMRQWVVNNDRHVPSWHAAGKQQSSKVGTFQGTGCVQGTCGQQRLLML